MSCDCGSCRANPNPRNSACVKTDKPIPENPLPDDLIGDFFNHLRETLESAGKLHRPAPGEPEDPRFAWFEHRAKERIRKGAETYGNRNFLRPSVDLVEEGTQECLDLANYVLMELTKTNPDACASVPLGMAAYYSFLAALALQDYGAKLRGSF